MNRLHLATILLGLASCGTGPATDDLRLPYRVLYARPAACAHVRGMVRFLEDHVASVKEVDLARVADEDPAASDLVIVDGDLYEHDETGRPLRRIGIAAPPFAALDGRPTVLMGGVGGRVGDLLRVKTSWVSG